MRGLHALVLAGKVLYIGASDFPAWVVMKANGYARQHGLTPFSLYQGKWNAAYRDMEAEIIPMCRDQGMALVPWEALGAGAFLSKEQRQAKLGGRQYGPPPEEAIKVSEKLEEIANKKKTTVQAVVRYRTSISKCLEFDTDIYRPLHISSRRLPMSFLWLGHAQWSMSKHLRIA